MTDRHPAKTSHQHTRRFLGICLATRFISNRQGEPREMWVAELHGTAQYTVCCGSGPTLLAAVRSAVAGARESWNKPKGVR